MVIVRLEGRAPGFRVVGRDLHHLCLLIAHRNRTGQTTPGPCGEKILQFLAVRNPSKCPLAATSRWTWAISSSGRLACFGAAVDHGVPQNMVSPVSCISAGLAHTCVLTQSGELSCYGDNTVGQCNIPANVGRVVAVAAGFYHTAAVKACGELICFGAPSSCNVPPGLGPVTAVAAGQQHTCVVTTNGQLACFGGNSRGQCEVPPNLGNVVAVAAGLSHTCAVQADGSLVPGTP